MIQQGSVRQVGLLRHVHDEFEKVDVRWKAQLNRRMEIFANSLNSAPKEHFNSEGRFSTGGKRPREIALFAFKAHQHRIYGTMVELASRQTFVGLKLICDKKRDRADQKMLKRIAQDFEPYA